MQNNGQMMKSDATYDINTDVAIIGLGPVGATLANLLGIAGVNTVVFEREAETYHLPRAVHFDDEVMRIFQALGLSDEISRDVILSPGMRFVDASGKLILDWSRPSVVSEFGWHPSYRFHQPDLERVLRDGLTRWSSVQTKSRSEVFALDTDASGVTVRFEDLTNGRLMRCRARYVVGCDGARSLVRRLIGSGMHDLGFHERWLVIDALLKRPRPDLGDYSLQHCDPLRPVTYVRGTGNRRRWEITLRPDEDSRSMVEPSRIWELLQKWVTPEDAELERSAVYTFHSVVAERWRAGRLLLAGDSAHQTPPFLGQGMCAGIRDASNLGWKLARILQGSADDTLLDTYESERAPHVREYIELAVRIGGIINTTAIDAGLPGGPRGDGPVLMKTVKPPLGPGLSVGRADLTGRLAPQPFSVDGLRMDDVTGYRFVVIATSEILKKISDVARAEAKRNGVSIVDDAAFPSVGEWLASKGLDAVLVRPDRYVMGGAKGASEFMSLLSAITEPNDYLSLAMG